MQYILLIHADEAAMAAMPEEEVASVAGAVDQFDRDIANAGQKIGSVRLQPAHMARTVRVRNGKMLSTDGPFAETREQLGGIYLINAADLDEAAGIAARLPTATFCTIEVRPLLGVDL